MELPPPIRLASAVGATPSNANAMTTDRATADARWDPVISRCLIDVTIFDNLLEKS